MEANAPRRSGGRLRWVVAVYAVLLLASTMYRLVDRPPPLRPYQESTEIPPVEGDDHVRGKPVRIAYRDSGSGSPPIVLLHGSPVASSSMMALHEALTQKGFRVLTPDLPGFERSSRSIPDYSATAHARYTLSWLDSLGVDSAHFVAYSMSGGVILQAYRMAPDRLRSAVMLSAIGVQELELTGDYHLNRAIHGLQLSALWFLREAIPHFGFLDNAMIGVSYARNFYDTDQRPLRAILERFEPPMLIVHAENDPLVPAAAAREHARLVPQSTLAMLGSGGHSLPFARADSTARLIGSFVDRVESGEARDRLQATEDRVLAAARPFDPTIIPRPSGFAILILMTLVAVATLASEDLAAIGSGLMAARGILTFPEATLAALAGIVIGDVGLYVAGRWLGRPLVNRRPLRWFVSQDRLRVGEKWFDEKGIRAVLLARFVPGTRLPTYLAAGILRAPFWRFFGYFMASAMLWTPAIVGASMLLGQRVLRYYDAFEAHALWVVVGLALMLLLAFRILPLFFTHTGRRKLAGKWKRLTTWEFWPPWILYSPVALWCVWLSIRYRSPLAFTAANPGIPHSGFVGESKSRILDLLPAHAVAPYTLLRGSLDERQSEARAFMVAENLDYPVVLKPDVGERGRGVQVVRSEEALEAWLRKHAGPAIIQQYVEGPEFGVFYVEDPGTGAGRVFSVTDKQFPTVEGDGRRTLHRLILDDPRAVAMLPTYEAAQAERLDDVPAAGQEVQLVELGTHCLGAVFLDGGHLITPALTEAFSRIARDTPGFHFGRFDVRGASAASLSAGRDFRIIELNGVTSEATSIYDPRNSLIQAWRTLFWQWDLAYRTGIRNREAGASVTGFRTLLRLLVNRSGGQVRP